MNGAGGSVNANGEARSTCNCLGEWRMRARTRRFDLTTAGCQAIQHTEQRGQRHRLSTEESRGLFMNKASPCSRTVVCSPLRHCNEVDCSFFSSANEKHQKENCAAGAKAACRSASHGHLASQPVSCRYHETRRRYRIRLTVAKKVRRWGMS